MVGRGGRVWLLCVGDRDGRSGEERRRYEDAGSDGGRWWRLLNVVLWRARLGGGPGGPVLEPAAVKVLALPTPVGQAAVGGGDLVVAALAGPV